MPRRIDPIIWQHQCDNQVDLAARQAGLSWEEIADQRNEVLRLRASIARQRSLRGLNQAIAQIGPASRAAADAFAKLFLGKA